MERIFMNIENSKNDEPHKFVLNLSQRLDLISSNNMLFCKTSMYFQYVKKYNKTVQNNKLKIIAPTWNDEFELPDSSYSMSKHLRFY